jgi:outer membrane protein assembly factor BamE (lipoprotein component of BamABCDE complex)
VISAWQAAVTGINAHVGTSMFSSWTVHDTALYYNTIIPQGVVLTPRESLNKMAA